MKEKLKEALLLMIIQIFLYILLCINFRAIAQVQYSVAILSDFAVASMNFFVIRKISKSNDSLHQWLGYVIGSVIGSCAGIYLSTLLH